MLAVEIKVKRSIYIGIARTQSPHAEIVRPRFLTRGIRKGQPKLCAMQRPRPEQSCYLIHDKLTPGKYESTADLAEQYKQHIS